MCCLDLRSVIPSGSLHSGLVLDSIRLNWLTLLQSTLSVARRTRDDQQVQSLRRTGMCVCVCLPSDWRFQRSNSRGLPKHPVFFVMQKAAEIGYSLLLHLDAPLRVLCRSRISSQFILLPHTRQWLRMDDIFHCLFSVDVFRRFPSTNVPVSHAVDRALISGSQVRLPVTGIVLGKSFTLVCHRHRAV